MNLVKGMEVYISYNLNKTRISFGVNDNMQKLSGTKQIIEYVNMENGKYKNVSIKGYVWHADDLLPADMPAPEEKSFDFDINRLDI